jgi:hypothetical protein
MRSQEIVIALISCRIVQILCIDSYMGCKCSFIVIILVGECFNCDMISLR